jgi:hypothetical protein
MAPATTMVEGTHTVVWMTNILNDQFLTDEIGRKYQVTGTLEQQRPPVLRYRLNVLQLTESDKHHLQSDPTFVPLPRVQDASATYFELPVNATVMLACNLICMVKTH